MEFIHKSAQRRRHLRRDELQPGSTRGWVVASGLVNKSSEEVGDPGADYNAVSDVCPDGLLHQTQLVPGRCVQRDEEPHL